MKRSFSYFVILLSLARGVSGQVVTRSDSAAVGSGLARFAVSNPAALGGRAVASLVVDTLGGAWNAHVARAMRLTKPGVLFPQDDSTAAYTLRFDVARMSMVADTLRMEAIWSLCSRQYRRESGQDMIYRMVRVDSGWRVIEARPWLLGYGDCSFGLNRRAR